MQNPFTFIAQGARNLTAYDGMVVLVSILLVFAMLVALSLIVTAEGKLFDAFTARKKAAAKAAFPQPQPAAAPAPAAPKAPPAVPPAANGIPPEVVAAIAAAVYAVEGEGAAVRGIRRLPGQAPRRRGVWGDAGVAEGVQPF